MEGHGIQNIFSLHTKKTRVDIDLCDGTGMANVEGTRYIWIGGVNKKLFFLLVYVNVKYLRLLPFLLPFFLYCFEVDHEEG